MPEEERRGPDPLDIGSFLVLLLAAGLFFYIAFYRTAEQNKRYFNSMARKADVEIQTLSDARSKKTRELKEKTDSSIQKEQKKQPDTGSLQVAISGVPMFLQKINKETIASGTELRDVKKVDNYTYQLTVFAPFYRLMNFLYKIEQSNLAIQNLDIRPFSTHNNEIHLTLKVIEDEMSQNNLLVLKDFEKKYAKTTRDPFQKGTAGHEVTGPPDVIDLTWEFKLSATGFDKAKYAHIDRKNYYEGDVFNGMRIVRIQKGRVDLESGSQKFFIGFRKPVSKK
jgi:hypothetical protein